MTAPAAAPALPAWARDIAVAYEAGAHSQFILSGNVHDRLALGDGSLGVLSAFLARTLLRAFDVVLAYDLGTGLRVERGGELFAAWPRAREAALPREARAAVDVVSHYARYCLNLARTGGRPPRVAVVVRDAELLLPAAPGHDAGPLACQVRDWANDGTLAELHLATFLICENRSDLHPLVANNPRALAVSVPLPDAAALAAALAGFAAAMPRALARFADLAVPAKALVGTTLSAVEALVRTRQHLDQPLEDADLAALKKQLVERDCAGLIEFLSSTRTLDDYASGEALKAWLRQDLALWRAGDDRALPKGYLLCGPVGTGKTYLVECLAGEAGVPVVKLKNFRDKWVGSTEGNLEKIFRLIRALGRCYVFIDEADQALGRRGGGGGEDGGIGGRIYGMMAEEMSRPDNRGRVVWILATSRPDLVEVDLKRPGRVDVKVPIFPTTTAEEGWRLLRALAGRFSLLLPKEPTPALHALIPDLLTPGAAEAVAVKAYRRHRTAQLAPEAALAEVLTGWHPPVAPSVIEHQIRLAVAEASDAAFVPEAIRARYG